MSAEKTAYKAVIILEGEEGALDKAIGALKTRAAFKTVKVTVSAKTPAFVQGAREQEDAARLAELAAAPKGKPGRPRAPLGDLLKIVSGEIQVSPEERARARRNLNQRRYHARLTKAKP